MSTRVLKTVVFMGSAKDISPPWGGPARMGDRVLAWVKGELTRRSKAHGSETVTHDVKVLDPKEIFAAGGALADSGAEVRIPTFFYAKDNVPPAVAGLVDIVKNADAFIVVSAEYNHSIPPALSGLMSHFGASTYHMKPCGIVTYSVGPYGGIRAAMALRPFLAELGILSVSKLTGIPTVQEVLKEDGTPNDPEDRFLKVFSGTLDQVEFLALAVLKQKEIEPAP